MQSASTYRASFLLLAAAMSAGPWPSASMAEEIAYQLSFDGPMSWSDDVVPWGLGATQQWEAASSGEGGYLRISGREHGKGKTWEMRTLQFNHKPGARARISFDIRRPHPVEDASFAVYYFDGHCGGRVFIESADNPYVRLPDPLFDSRKTPVSDEWQRVNVEVGPLAQTVLTLVFSVRQAAPTKPETFVEYHLDNLHVRTEALDRLMDPDFSWDGRNLSTRHLWASTVGADIDWCTFGDQEDVTTPEGGTIHYTLLQFRDTSSRRDAVKHNYLFYGCDDGMGGRGTIALNRESSAGSCAASWGLRQTAAYSALGLKRGEPARIRLRMKMTNLYAPNGTSQVQLGVDPRGGVRTREAIWSEPYVGDYFRDGWHTAQVEFDRPADAAAFTVYFRHRDGKPEEPRFPLPFPEPQSMGSAAQNTAVADWVHAEVVK